MLTSGLHMNVHTHMYKCRHSLEHTHSYTQGKKLEMRQIVSKEGTNNNRPPGWGESLSRYDYCFYFLNTDYKIILEIKIF